jgi:hypothetical protein
MTFTLALIALWAGIIGAIVLAVRHSRIQTDDMPAVVEAVELPNQPGFIYILSDSCDDRRSQMVKVIGSRKPPVTPLDIVYWFRAARLDVELNALYNELSGFRIAGSWYDRDAVNNYIDHRLGKV